MKVGDANLAHHLLQFVKEHFKAEAGLLVLLEEGNDQLVTRRTFSSAGDQPSQASLKLEEGLIAKCIRSGRLIQAGQVSAEAQFNPSFDGMDGIQVRSLVCAPLAANGKVLGAIAVLNLPQLPLNGGKVERLSSIAASLASSILAQQSIQQLKIANADLEASRWELLNSRNTLRALFDSIPTSIYIVDRRYNLIAVNMSRADRANKKPSLLVGGKCYEELYELNAPCAGCRVHETLLNGRTTTRTGRQWTAVDAVVEWEISTFAILDQNNTPIQVIVLEQDITEKRRLEANLIQSEKLAAVGQLAAGVAHEINNPLSAIIANAQILRRDLTENDPDTLESLRLIELAGVRASQVVRNLLGFARKEQYHFAPTNVNATIQDALTLLQHEFVARDIRLTTDLGKDLPLIHASHDHLQSVWINLILNAFDAIEDNQGEVQVASRLQANEIRVTVTDNGKGIPPERVSRIFEPFFTTKMPGRGTGLGLSVCHRIVKQHGGYIQVESQIGRGTTFITTLPIVPA